MNGSAKSREKEEITGLLRLASDGDKDAANRLLEAVERELRKLASNQLRRERRDHTLQPTALMNEAVIRLMKSDGSVWSDRGHFFAVASTTMRRILVDYARARNAAKRRPDRVTLPNVEPMENPPTVDVLDLHLALEEFALHFPLGAQLMELRFFGGLTHDEAAKVLNMSERGADEEWRFAKAWLRSRLQGVKKDCE